MRIDTKKQYVLFVTIAAVCVVAEAAGLVFAFGPAISLVRPGAGIALAAVLIFGYRALPGIAAGTFIAYCLILQSLGETLSLRVVDTVLASMGLAGAEALEAATALWLLRIVDFRRNLQSVADVVKFVGFAAVISTWIGAVLGTFTLYMAGVVSEDLLARAFLAWWFGNAIAALAIAPFLLTWQDRCLGRRRRWEAVCVGTLLVVACQIAFGEWSGINQTSYPLAFLPFPLVMWAALRFRGFGAAVASAFTTIAGVFSILRTQQLLDWESAFVPTLIQYAFSGSICVTALLIAATQSERRRAEERRRARDSQFRSLLSAIPDALFVFDAEGHYRQIFTADTDLIVDQPENLLGKRLHEAIPKKPADLVLRIIDQVITSGQPVDTNYPLTIQGVSKRFSARVVPYGDADDPLVLWVARDISDLHHTQSKLKADEALMRNLLQLQEDERKLLSYELHDGLVQYMVGAHMALEGVFGGLHPDQRKSRESLTWSRDLIRQSIDEARNLISELRPLIIDESGIVESIGYLINDQLGTQFKVRFIPLVEGGRLPPLLEATVFRIVQELFCNIRKHSQAKRVEIKIVQTSRSLEMMIEDDGFGFDVEDSTIARFGIDSIRKRVDLFGGKSSIQSIPGKGTRVNVTLPFELPTSIEPIQVTPSSMTNSIEHPAEGAPPTPPSSSETPHR